MKTPDKIKRAMEGCHTFDRCSGCPYYSRSVTLGCKRRRNADALAYIKRLEAERDAAVSDLKKHVGCAVCKHYKTGSHGICLECYRDNELFEWRGIGGA